MAILQGLLFISLISFTISSSLIDSNPRIIGGFPAEQNATRHQVSIRYRTLDAHTFGRGHICGGSLINERAVLTAAHCLVDLEYGHKVPAGTLRVVGGSIERLRITADTVIRDVAQTFVHEAFSPSTIQNDIALIILSEPIPVDHPTLRPINRVTTQPAAATACQVSGWGTTIFGQSASPPNLLAANVTVQPTEFCNSTDSYNGHMAPGMFCASEDGEDACQGDSGGPLVCEGQLAGVVSHGKSCALEGFPGIYTDVAFYGDWIERCLAGGCSDAGRKVTSVGALMLVGLLVAVVYQ